MADPTPAHTGPSQWVRGAIWAMGIGLGLVTMLFGTLHTNESAFNSERHSRVSDRIAEISRRNQILVAKQDTLAREISTLTARVLDHEKASDEWKERIVESERILHSLQSESGARPDPWTGTQARAEARRTDKLELQMSKFDFFIPEFIQLREEVRKLKEAKK